MKIGGDKKRNASGHQGENERQGKKQEHKQQNFWWAHTTFPTYM